MEILKKRQNDTKIGLISASTNRLMLMNPIFVLLAPSNTLVTIY
jgi:hypothetical protein